VSVPYEPPPALRLETGRDTLAHSLAEVIKYVDCHLGFHFVHVAELNKRRIAEQVIHLDV
jgi:hypothetical protein